MSHRTPPKSKTTARRLIPGAAAAAPARRLGRLDRRIAVAGEPDPAALPQARFIEHPVLRAGGLVLLELGDGVIDPRFVPLLLDFPGVARGQRQERHGNEEDPEHGAGHDTMAPPMFKTTVAGSLPKPAWLAPPNTLGAPWLLQGAALEEGKRDAVLLAFHDQEGAGIDIVTDGEQTRRHFVWGFVEQIEGIDFSKMVTIGIRADRYKADVPTVTAPIRRRGPIHSAEVRFARAHTQRQLKFTIPGPMTIVDTIHDAHYKSRARLGMEFARLINEEARELEALGVDMIQLDEPAFNVYMDEVRDWGIEALDRAVEGLRCRTAVHICYGYGIKANTEWKQTLGSEWRQYEDIFPAIAKSPIQQVAIECRNSKVPLDLLTLLTGKIVQAGVIDVASDTVETAEDVVKVIEAVAKFVPKANIVATTNCGMAPMRRDIAEAKLMALGAGAKLARQRFG